MELDSALDGKGFEAASAVADAVLYEGYLLYPYRRSSGKNKVRWQFGVLTPRSWTEANGADDTTVAGSVESWWQQTECLVEAPEVATVNFRFRFLQLQHRSVHERLPGGSHRPVDTLGSAFPFDEAVPCEFDFQKSLGDLLAGEAQFALRLPGEQVSEEVFDGGRRGRISRERWPLTAVAKVSAWRCETPFPLYRLRVRVENTDGADRSEEGRDEVLRRSLLASHTLLAVERGSFMSLLDPPRWAEEAARACRNVHTYPVLAGPEGRDDLVLSSPILLYDHPRVAPESPGDLHDATEIDEILSLRTRTLTDAEKREARATDARAAEILDRVDGMPEEVLAKLHGAVRTLGPAGAPADEAEEPVFRPAAPWWDPGADASVSPGTDSVMVDGTPVSKGSRVRLKPRRHGTDPQDRFLDGRIAQVEAVLLDVDDAHHLAVSLEDDPGTELNRWYGRFRYFSPDEVVPLTGEAGAG